MKQIKVRRCPLHVKWKYQCSSFIKYKPICSLDITSKPPLNVQLLYKKRTERPFIVIFICHLTIDNHPLREIHIYIHLYGKCMYPFNTNFTHIHIHTHNIWWMNLRREEMSKSYAHCILYFIPEKHYRKKIALPVIESCVHSLESSQCCKYSIFNIQ